MKLATTTADFLHCSDSQQDIMECISSAEFRYLDYSFHIDYKYKNGIYSNGYSEHILAIKRKEEKLCTKFVQAHSPMINYFETDSYFEIMEKCISACAELGIENVVVHSPVKFGCDSKDEHFTLAKDVYSRLLHFAEKSGVNILTENYKGKRWSNTYWTDNASDILEMIEYINHPLFHAVWDTGHGNINGAPQDESIKILGNHLRAVHIHDNDGENDMHTAPLFGKTDFGSVIRGLKSVGYSGYFTFEATQVFLPSATKMTFGEEKEPLMPSKELRTEAEKLLYSIGKYMLSEHNCFEE